MRAARFGLAALLCAAALIVPRASTLSAPTSALRARNVGTVPQPRTRGSGPAPLALYEPFTTDSTTPGAWSAIGDACLTAGDSATPSTSIAACNASSPIDASGKGALELTTSAAVQTGLALFTTPLSTTTGLQITFTDAAFNGTGGNGMALVLTDASAALPTAAGGSGQALGYEPGGGAGIANAYLGVGLDEYGQFSQGGGGPGKVPESIAVRGAASTSYQYIAGSGPLGFSLDSPSSTTRPASAPTVRVTLLASGALTVEIDRHNGSGFRTYLTTSIVGVSSQPVVPPLVYLGFSASTGDAYELHQIQQLSVRVLPASPTTFSPAQITNLAAWYDAGDSITMSYAGQGVSAWQDRSGNGNVLAQTSAAALPGYITGINRLGSLSFAGAGQFLQTNGSTFSSDLFNESTVFVVTNQNASATAGNVLWSGTYPGGPDYSLRLLDGGATRFDFGNASAGRLSANDLPSGPAIWTAAGSVSASTQLLRKNGNTLASGTGPGASTSGSYPLIVGAATSGANPYTGEIAEVLVYNRFLTAAEQASAEGYLACKWGLQNRLPASHPYHNVCPQSGTYRSLPVAPLPSGALPNPPALTSKNGQLIFNVTATQNATTGYPQLVYNGSTTPPTLRLLPGDTLLVNITNNMPVPSQSAGYLNDVSLHYHGLQVSPNAPADDSIDMIAMPGQALHYRVPIPLDHPPGLYWYHSHAHGEAERQTLAGMSGALIIDGISSYTPAVANLPERIIIARETEPSGGALPAANRKQLLAMRWAMTHGPHRSSMPGMDMRMDEPMKSMSMNLPEVKRTTTRGAQVNPYIDRDLHYRTFRRSLVADTHCTGSETAPTVWTLNGATQPSIGIRPGEQQFWRVVNAGADSYLDIAVDNATLQLVALDGVPLSAGVNAPSSLTVSDYVLPPASRAEFIVTGPPSGSAAYFRTLCFDQGSAGPANPAAILATIDPTSSPTDQSRHRQRVSPRARRYHFHSVRFITTQPVARQQTLYYGDQDTINGQTYDPSGTPLFYAQSGTVEEWTIVNNSSQVHTFHMHQVHFVVANVNGVAPAQQFVLDNVNIPAATANGPGSVQVLLDFTDPTIIGTFLVHCHILSHEDGGMMAKIRVGTAAPMSLGSSSVTFASPGAASQNVTITGGQAPYTVSGCSGVATGSISGTTLTVSPSGAGNCTMVVEDSTGLTASLQVTVNTPASIVLNPTSVGFANPAATPAAVAISGGVAPYGASACTGTATSSVSGSTLTVTPEAAGSCTIDVTDSASDSIDLPVSVNGYSGAAAADNVTFHQNPMRTGWYQSETTLNTTNVASANFGLVKTLSAPSGSPAFGKVYAQPLYVTSERASDGNLHNLVIVATATDQVYAFDDQTYAVVWHSSFTNTANGITQQSYTSTGCGDVNPDIGITGTPVIDRSADRMYVVVPTDENGTFHMRLHALALGSGADAVTPVEVTATATLSGGGTATTNPEYNFQRGALLEANGTIYVPLSSHCDYDSSSVHGWVLGYNSTTLAAAGTVLDTTNQNIGEGFLGAVWMSGFGPAADSQGNVYFATGNGPINGTADFGMSVLQVPGSLVVSGSPNYFSPVGAPVDSQSDADLGAGGVVLFPNVSGTYPHLLIGGGKCGSGSSNGGTQGCQKYILNRDALGGVTTGDTGALWHADTGGGMFGGEAFFQDTNGASYVVFGGGSPITTYLLNLSPVSLSSYASASVGCLECRDSGSQPVVSSQGTNPGTAIVWALKTPGGSGGNISLYAFDALKMTVLFDGVAGDWTVGSGASYIAGALVSPTIANGKVYVPTDGSVAVFGIKQ